MVVDVADVDVIRIERDAVRLIELRGGGQSAVAAVAGDADIAFA
jgi:hypothetical protein